MRRMGFLRQPGYMAQKRIYVRFKAELIRMQLHERARGDTFARPKLSGFCTPGIELSRGGLWVLPLSRSERKEERALRTGIKRAFAKPKRRLAGVVRVTLDSGSVRLLKSRPQVNGTRRPRR